MTDVKTLNVRVGAGRVHRATVVVLGSAQTACGRTLSNATETTDWVNCKSCWEGRR